MSKPIVAIVGRPNVGKSTFFNKIVGRRVSIVEDTPGVTRDRIYAEAEWNGAHFALIDTGGIEPNTDDIILSQMREQAQVAMDMADVILFITDGKDGLTHADREVAMMLMRTGKRVILVVNKIDKPSSLPDDFYDFAYSTMTVDYDKMYRDMFPLKEYDFEGYRFFSVNNADVKLKEIYGNNYMGYPPKLTCGHSKFLKLAEKDKEIIEELKKQVEIK